MSKEKLFSFKVEKYNLDVVSFRGTQVVSELYTYEIELISKDVNIDFDDILSEEICLVLHNQDKKDSYIHGVLKDFEAYKKIDEYVYYKATLVPKLWWLSLAHHQQIFLDKKVPDIIEEVLTKSQFTSNDYEFRLKENYDKREYVCQYKESRYEFIKRWMQRDGLYFYFEQKEESCKLIITDDKVKQQKAQVLDTLRYSPSSGMQSYSEQLVLSLVYRSNNTIKSVQMKNFNYEKPSRDINSAKNSKGTDYTQTYMFGHNILTQNEATKLTQINEERFLCQAKEMVGESNISSLTPGYIYSLKDYFREDLNDDYMMLQVDSEGSQRGFLTAGVSNDGEDSSYYKNSFIMIPANTQYRSQVTVPWPHIGGMLSAKIDAAGSGDTAELDKYGRYKVIMPFDISGRGDAKASAYLRMAQPSAGKEQGIHFPLHKGTEVLVAFKGGDPDQPIITGAVPNLDTPSPVADVNETSSKIVTDQGDVLIMEDKDGDGNRYIQLGMKEDDNSLKNFIKIDGGKKGDVTKENSKINLTTQGNVEFNVEDDIKYNIKGDEYKNGEGNRFDYLYGAKEDIVLGGVADIAIGGRLDATLIAKVDFSVALMADIISGYRFEWVTGPTMLVGQEMTRTHSGNVTTKAKNKTEEVEETLTSNADNINIKARRTVQIQSDEGATITLNDNIQASASEGEFVELLVKETMAASRTSALAKIERMQNARLNAILLASSTLEEGNSIPNNVMEDININTPLPPTIEVETQNVNDATATSVKLEGAEQKVSIKATEVALNAKAEIKLQIEENTLTITPETWAAETASGSIAIVDGLITVEAG